MIKTVLFIFVKVLRSLLWLISFLFNYKLLKGYKIIKDRIIVEGIKREFKYCGENFWIDSPSEFKGLKYISVGNNFHSRSGLRMEAINEYLGVKYSPEIKIGNNVRFNNYCHIGIINNLFIGDNTVIASKVFITDHSHGKTDGEDDINILVANRELYSKGPVFIGENVWIGENVSILSGVSIGKGSIVGANSVVNKDIPDFCVAAGAPAKVIRKLKE